MPSSINKIVERFPFQTTDPIVGAPNYETIAEVHLTLNSNAVSVHSNLGKMHLGPLLPDSIQRRICHPVGY